MKNLLVQINNFQVRNNFKLFIFVFLLFLPSFLYGGNNNLSLILSSLLIQFFFLTNINNFDFRNFKNLFFLHILLIVYCCFQLLPLSFFLLSYFSHQHLILYNLLGDISYTPISLNPFASFKNIVIFFNIFLIFLIVPQIINSKKTLNFILKIIILFGFLHVVMGLFVEIFDLKKILLYEKKFYIGSLTGFFINRNNFSYFLLLIFIINFYYLGFYRKFFLTNTKKISTFYQIITSDLILYRITLVFISIGIILTKSRAGNLSFIIILFVILLFEIFKYKKLSFNIILIITVVLFDLVVVSNYLGFEKLLDRISSTSIDGEASRLSIFMIGLKEFINFPIFGYGYGGFEILYRLKHDIYSTFYNHVHNDLIQFIGEFGLVGTSLFLIWFYQLILIFKKRYKNNIYELNMIIILSFIVTFIHSNLDFALHIPGNIYFIFFILSLSLTNIQKKYN